MSRSIFVSHAVADKPLVEAFVRFLEDGIGVPEDKIFCVSIPGMGIPTGTSFVNYIRDEMDEPALVVMLITPNYLASRFCQGEMGAAWIKGHKIYPIIVPPATYADLDGVFLGLQAVKIDDDVKVNELKEVLMAAVSFTPKSPSRWDMIRKEFFAKLPGIVAALPKPKTVTQEAYGELETKYADALAEMRNQDAEIERLASYAKTLEKLKDKIEVNNVAAGFAKNSITEHFDILLANVKIALKEIGGSSVRVHVLAKYYGKPNEVSRDDSEEFSSAIRRNILWDDFSLKTDSVRVKKVVSALDEVDNYIRENDDVLLEYVEENFKAPLETDNEEFWFEHYF